jgi:excisionase family DNA binding protein
VALLTVVEVVSALKVDRATVYRLMGSGQLRWVQIGARRRVSATELERFVAEHTVSAA